MNWSRDLTVICLFLLIAILFLCIRARWYQEGFEQMFQRIKSGVIENDSIDAQYMRDDTKMASGVYFYVNDQIPTGKPPTCPPAGGGGIDISQLTDILNGIMGSGDGSTYDQSFVSNYLKKMGINLGGGSGAGSGAGADGANAPSGGPASVLSTTSLQYQYSFESEDIVGNKLTNVATKNPDAIIYNMTISTTNPAVGSGSGSFENKNIIPTTMLDRSAQFLVCPDLNSANYTNGISMSVWMYPKKPANQDIYYMALCLGNNYTDNIYIGFKNEGLYYGINGKDGYGLNNVPSEMWTHVAWTISNSGTHTLYINGVDAGIPETDGLSYMSNHTYPFAIGYNYVGLPRNMADYFCGYLDEIRIYNRVLSSGEVTSLFQKTDVA